MLQLEKLVLRQGDFCMTADFSVPAGITAVIGPSGGGKSTLLSGLAGFMAPASGTVIWHGENLVPLAPGARSIAMLFQDNNLFPHLTVVQNLGLAMVPKLRLSKAQDAQVAKALSAVGLADMGARKPSALSGGQQSRAALARTLLANRDIVLLDEAFAALGPALRADMLGLVRDRFSGKTVLMVTHDPADARLVSDHVILVADGVAYPPVPTTQMFDDPPAALRAYLGTDDDR